MKNIRCYMSETVFYQLVITVDDDATDDDIAKEAEKMFVQGRYEACGQDDRKLDSWESD